MFTAHSLTVAIPINHCPGPWNDYQFMLHFPCVLESSSSAFCGEISAFGFLIPAFLCLFHRV
jgi:hypothetical protein